MKKVLEIWNHRDRILEGIKNSVFKKSHIEEIAKARMEICNSCENIDRNGDKCVMPGTQPCCGLCGCKLAWKTRALSEGCDIHKWKALVSYEDEKLIDKKLRS